jgi:ATP-dependent Clp protease ATP-binding subunit ClpB
MPKVRKIYVQKKVINHLRDFRTKNNPVLIGEPGVGKTSIAEGLAQRIVKRDVPASLIARLFSLDMGALMAGAKYKGEYEERIKAVLNEIEKSAEDGAGVILFIDELHLIMAGRGAEGGGMDAANLFKPLLARGKLRYFWFISTVVFST